VAVSRIAKITRPILTEVFPRKRLFEAMDRSRKRPVTWIAGPPGCGKTTLVSSYLDARKLPCLWYQVDPGDADPATFFYYLGLAAREAAPRKRKPLPLLTPEYRQGMSTFTLRYFEDLFARLKTPSAVVFDNYQEAPEEAPFHEIILNGLSRIPEGIKAILISRRNPPPAFTRLRANHQMEILGWNELRLTLEETGGIIRLRAREKQTKETISLLHKAADGWTAGLVLMLESVEKGVIEPQALGKLTPDEIFDYFAKELLDKTDRETRGFLLQTAFLPKMTPKMAEDLTGLPNARRILDALSRTHYFTEKRFHGEPVYQYHMLFREFLLSRAQETLCREDRSILLLRAAILLENSGQTEDAVPLFRDAGRWDEMVELIRKHASSMLQQGRNRPLAEWLKSLPPEILEGDPWLLYWMGECQAPFDIRLGRFYFEKAFEKFRQEEGGVGIFLAWAGVVNSIINEFQDFRPLDQWIAVLGELMGSSGSFPSEEVGLRVSSVMLLALEMRHPHHPEIEKWADRLLVLSEGSPNISEKIMGYARLAYFWVQMGDFQKGGMAIHRLRELSRQRDIPPVRIITANFHESIYNRFAGLHEECLKTVSAGLEQSQKTGSYHVYNWLLIHGIASSLNVHDLGTANTFLEKLTVSLAPNKPWETNMYYLLKAQEALARGKPGEAAIHAEMAHKFAGQVGAPNSLLIFHIVKAHVMQQLNKQQEADSHISVAADLADRMGSKLYQFSILLANALFAFDRGEQASGLVSLKRALAIGREGGYFYTYINQPYKVAMLCEKLLEAGIEIEYVQEIIRRLNIIPEKPPLHLENWPWPLKINTLGSFELWKDGKPIRFSRKAQQKPLSMLKALVALGGRGVREDEIADALWPDADGDMAYQSFRTTLHRLRQLLGNEKAVQIHEGQMTLDDRTCWVDVWAFERLLEQAEAQWKKGKGEEAAQLTEKALEIYKGPFLRRDVKESWALSMNERLKTKFMFYISKLGDHWQKAEQWEKAVKFYLRGLEIDDLSEEFYRSLMLCYQKLDRRAEAIAVFRRCQRILFNTLHIEPSAKTQSIYKVLLSKERGSGEPAPLS
jgi:ATP/maltotriose-dependent transcriptional regulator MalT/DNA-binding SARP family transcriptional activator